MSNIGHRTHYVGYPDYRGLITGTLGREVCVVQWDDPLESKVAEVPTADLVILPETEYVDDGFLDGDPDPIR
ncbi:MAG: hypothetical protein LC749_12360 [Actinobacteria bacterium]|nr:hypothetical protein [Actinomycetota bacterium]